jgi:hypothetical protein
MVAVRVSYRIEAPADDRIVVVPIRSGIGLRLGYNGLC